jgi:hypothetical protein
MARKLEVIFVRNERARKAAPDRNRCSGESWAVSKYLYAGGTSPG